MKLILVFIATFIRFISFTQVEEIDSTSTHFDSDIIEIGYCDPIYPGGEAAMMKFISDTIKYPKVASEMGIQGIVYVQFVVNKDGSIEHVNAVLGPDESLECAAEEAIAAMPKWDPAICKGKAFRVRYTLPITFRLY